MTNFLKFTLNKVGQANNYSKLGKAAPGKVPENHISISQQVAVASNEILRELKSCWKEVALDLTQLGLSLVGLIEVAPPVQATADIANGGIDIARGHPIIGAISIGTATPFLGFLPGIGISIIRFFKVIWSGLKFIALTVAAPVRIAWRFILMNRKSLFTYLPKTDEIVEGAVNVGKEIKNALISFYEKLKRAEIKEIDPQKVEASPYTVNQHPNSIFDKGTEGYLKEHEARSKSANYGLYNGANGNIGKGRYWTGNRWDMRI